MRAVWTLTLLVACHGVGQTGPRGLKGRLLDQDGQPIANQYITTVEGGAETAEDGTFEVRWKEPNTSATFTRAGMDWRRSLLPDDPPVVDIALPHTAEGEISCRSELRCMAELAWDLGGGLSAHHELECGERTPVARIPSLPPGEPTVVCSTVKGDLDLAISRANGRISITSKPQPRPVVFVASAPGSEEAPPSPPEGTDPRGSDAQGEGDHESAAIVPLDAALNCRAEVFDGEIVDYYGQVGLAATDDTWAWARCVDRIGPPVAVSPRPANLSEDDALVQLTWSPSGVDLRLEPPVPEPRALTLIHSTEAGAVSWQLRVEPDASGTYQLPPLPRGEYRLGLGAPRVVGLLNPPIPEVPGEILLVSVAGEWGTEGGFVGALRLEEDMAEGKLTYSGAPPSFDAAP